MFRFVEQPVIKPNQCAVYPQLGHQHEKGYIDTGNELPWDSHVYVSVHAVEELAQFIGLPTKEQLDGLTELAETQAQQIEEQARELQELREFERSARYTVESMGQRIRRKPGPRKKEEATA
jgi:hypothetical protein